MKRTRFYHGMVPMRYPYRDELYSIPTLPTEIDPHRRHRWVKPDPLVPLISPRRKS